MGVSHILAIFSIAYYDLRDFSTWNRPSHNSMRWR